MEFSLKAKKLRKDNRVLSLEVILFSVFLSEVLHDIYFEVKIYGKSEHSYYIVTNFISLYHFIEHKLST
jgi:hypothetical protein